MESQRPQEELELVATTGGKSATATEDARSSSEAQEKRSNAFFRVFFYNDIFGWATTVVAIVCMVATGVLLPLMNVVFGKFVNVFNDFVSGHKTPAEFRSDINHFTLVQSIYMDGRRANGTNEDYRLYFVYLFVAKFVLFYFWTAVVSINAIRLTKALRADVLIHTLRHEVAFFDTSNSGSVSSNINSGGNLVTQGVSEKFGLTVQAATTFFASFVVAFVVQWKLTLITMCIVPAILIVISVCVTFDSRIEKKILARRAEADKLAEDVFGSIKTAHAFWAFSKLSGKYRSIMADTDRIAKGKPPLYAGMFCIQFFCIYAGYALAFWQGVHMYNRGEISQPGDIVTVILAVLLATQGLTQIAPQIMIITKAAAAAEQLFELIDHKPQIDALSQDGIRPSQCVGNIAFDNVSFAYPSRPEYLALIGLTLSIPAQKTTAIVGPSGSGKSTVIALLERWYSYSSGSIDIDGSNIKEINASWLRSTISLVQQEPTLFSGTIIENVAFGLPDEARAALSKTELRGYVEQACKDANADEFIVKLPEGYDTDIGQRGSILSGGQRQRLAIARAIISNPRVLLLDEATSALDATSEKLVQSALNNLMKDRTVVVIAHRLSTVRHADNIAVMSKGSIVEQGTHEELLQLGGVYSGLATSQNLGAEVEDDDSVQVIKAEGAGDGMLTAKDAAAPAQSLSFGTGGLKEPHLPMNYGLMKSVFLVIREQQQLKFPFLFILIAAVIGGGSNPALAVLFSRTLDCFTLKDSALVERGNFYSLMFFVLALGNLVSYSILGWMSSIVSQKIFTFYRSALFDDILRQEISFFDRSDNRTGALMSRLSTEPEALQELFSSNISLIVTILVNLVSSCLLGIGFGWKLGLVLTFGALPPLVGAGYARIYLETRLDEATASRFAESAAVASEALLAMRTVSSLNLERMFLGRYEDTLKQLEKKATGTVLFTMFWYSLSQSMSFLAMALGFWYGGRLMSTGEYTAQQFYTVFIAVLFSGEAAASLFGYTSSIAKAKGAANYMFDLRNQVSRDMKDTTAMKMTATNNDVTSTSVHCKEVGFTYPERPNDIALSNISFTAPKGAFVALVGASGSGKTTMMSLLERFYEPGNGSIYLDEVDSKSLDRCQYRRRIAYVQQEPVLYQGSIRDNIALGIDDATDLSENDIWKACQDANIDIFIKSLPEGLSTPCGSQGTQLSGGQRQRIALARSFVRKPQLLLLDEATSNLDTESERLIQSALQQTVASDENGTFGRCTTIAVAHRLSTIMHADMIHVFSDGRIIERGTHQQLIANKGPYYGLCLAQTLDI